MIKRLHVVEATIPSGVERLVGAVSAVRQRVERERSAAAHAGAKVARHGERQLEAQELLRQRALAAQRRRANLGARHVEAVGRIDLGAAEIVGVRELVAQHACDLRVGVVVKLILAQRDALPQPVEACRVARRTPKERPRHSAPAVRQRLHQPAHVVVCSRGFVALFVRFDSACQLPLL